MRYLVLLFIAFSFLHGLSCDGYINLNTGQYDYRCAADMLNIPRRDYSSTMAVLGGLTGLTFIVSIIFIILHIGRSHKV